MIYKIIKELLNKIKKRRPKILVIGDVMLDQYVIGKVNRISPEAPVPILNFEQEEFVLGGAGNVAHNLFNLKSEVSLATIIGDDLDGALIIDLLKSLDINSDFIFSAKNISTTKKTRFIAEGTHLLRLDNDSKEITDTVSELLAKKVLGNIKKFDFIIISDYNKGVCKGSVVRNIINKAKLLKVPVLIDPKGSNWGKYLNATGITPNKKEVEEQLNLKLKFDSDFQKAAKVLIGKYQLDFCIITRGAEGMTFLSQRSHLIHQKVEKKEVFDVSGAGDTAIACLAVSLSSGLSIDDSMKIACSFSSEVVTHIGTVPFNIGMIKYNE